VDRAGQRDGLQAGDFRWDRTRLADGGGKRGGAPYNASPAAATFYPTPSTPSPASPAAEPATNTHLN
jgi:hypothetical protein